MTEPDAVVAILQMVEDKFTKRDETVREALKAADHQVQTALNAVNRESELHAQAHAREHTAIQTAMDKAEKYVDQRLGKHDEATSELKDLVAKAANRDDVDAVKKLLYVGLGMAIMISFLLPIVLRFLPIR